MTSEELNDDYADDGWHVDYTNIGTNTELWLTYRHENTPVTLVPQDDPHTPTLALPLSVFRSSRYEKNKDNEVGRLLPVLDALCTYLNLGGKLSKLVYIIELWQRAGADNTSAVVRMPGSFYVFSRDGDLGGREHVFYSPTLQTAVTWCVHECCFEVQHSPQVPSED